MVEEGYKSLRYSPEESGSSDPLNILKMGSIEWRWNFHIRFAPQKIQQNSVKRSCDSDSFLNSCKVYFCCIIPKLWKLYIA